MKILLAASECAPLTGPGEIGIEVSRLARGLKEAGHEVSVILPGYREARMLSKARRTRVKFPVSVGPGRCVCEVFEGVAEGGIQVFLTVRDEFFDRSGLYGNESGDYQDNAARFIFFSKAVVELARRMDPSPEVLHAHGWQAALTAVFAGESGLRLRTVLSPQGLEYQGNFWSYDFGLTNLPGGYFSAGGLEFYGSMNFLKGGILFSDAVILPGDRFVAAAQSARDGCGLENVLRDNAAKLRGIPTGNELDGWDPANDSALGVAFPAGDAAARETNSAESVFGWTGEGNGADIVAFAGASDAHETLLQSLDLLVPMGARVGFLGRPSAVRAAAVAARRHAGKFTILEDFEESAARRALAGCDFLLIPGAASPLSPWPSRALRYGAIPIARQCPGIHQWVTEWEHGRGTGFLFFDDSAAAIVDAVRKATASAPARPAILAEMAAAADGNPRSVRLHEEVYSGAR